MAADMQLMVDFTTAILEAISAFLLSPPIFYLFCLICFVLVCKAFKILIK